VVGLVVVGVGGLGGVRARVRRGRQG
jgi:hypothetical protein